MGRLVRVDAGGRPVRGGDHKRAWLTSCRPGQSPVLPPVFASTRTSRCTAAGSTALTMSITASAGDRDRGQRLHLDARTVRGPHRRRISTPSSATSRSTFDPVDRDRVAQRDEVGVRLAP